MMVLVVVGVLVVEALRLLDPPGPQIPPPAAPVPLPPHHRKSLSAVFIFHDRRDVFRAIKKHGRDFALNCSSTICVVLLVIATVSPVLHHSLRRNAVERTQVPTRRSSRMRLGKAAPSPGALGSVSGHSSSDHWSKDSGGPQTKTKTRNYDRNLKTLNLKA